MCRGEDSTIAVHNLCPDEHDFFFCTAVTVIARNFKQLFVKIKKMNEKGK